MKATNTNLCVLVWDDKFDSLVSGGDFLKAICQTGLEILGELRRLQTMRRIVPKEYCGVLTNGRDWVLVSCLISESGKRGGGIQVNCVLSRTGIPEAIQFLMTLLLPLSRICSSMPSTVQIPFLL